MIVQFKDTSLKLNSHEVKAAKRAISRFLDNVKGVSEKELTPTYYFTLLLMMHLISQELLNDFDQEVIEEIMTKLGRFEE